MGTLYFVYAALKDRFVLPAFYLNGQENKELKSCDYRTATLSLFFH